jgi:2-polyprenyl-3-methyl-5-hydroxy-6-metoxy-1,4-benzoquinol methylase
LGHDWTDLVGCNFSARKTFVSKQDEIDVQNEAWWNELCGSAAARLWGITDDSPASLKRFDDNFFAFYPYVEKWIRWETFAGKRTLEIGLGYGSVTQRLAQSCAALTAIDIASAPVAMANHRFRQTGLDNGRAVQGNILRPPVGIGKFDRIVAIGCLHHTGNLAEAIDVCYDLLEPGGQLIAMVYYTFSHRQWWNNYMSVAQHLRRELRGYRGTFRERAGTEAYDQNSDGSPAPSTEFASVRTMQALCSRFSSVEIGTENTNPEGPFRLLPRKMLLATALPRWAGLDLYWIATK